MNVHRSVFAAVAAWLAVVALGSTVVWTVISRAGDGIAPTADPGVVATSSSPGGSTGSSPSASQGPSAGAPVGPVAVRRTWQGAGGLVIASCRRSSISLVSSSADLGFRVEIGSRGPEELELAFEGQGEEGRETTVKARCLAGTPEFDVTTSD